MAPTPSAGKATSGASSGSAPKTPTKLGRKPQSAQTPKLGQSSSSGSSNPKDAASGANSKASGATSSAKDAAKSTKDTAASKAKDVESEAEGATSEAENKIDLKDEEGDDEDEGPLSKVSQAKDDAKGKADEASQDVKDTADDATEKAEDTADDVTEKAGDVAESNVDEDEEEEEETGDDATDAGGKVAGDAKKSAGDAKKSAGGVLSGAQGLAGKAQGLAGKAKEDPSKVADDAKDTAEETAKGAKDTAEDATDDAQKVAGDAGDAAGDAVEDAEDTAKDATSDAKETADETAEQADDAEQTADDTADDTAEQAGDAAEETADKDELDVSKLPVNLDVLKGLEVQSDGQVHGEDGPIGKLVEGDAEDLEGYPIGENGEILDDDGDLVGRVELLPDEVRKQLAELKEKGELPEGVPDDILDQLPDTEEDDNNLPGLHILNGLTCDPTGLIFNDDGDTIGQVVDGDPEQLQNATLNENGEFIDSEGNVIGHAQVHPEAAGLYNDAEDAAEDAADGIEDQLPGVEALEGRELNEAGEIVGDDGAVLGQLEGDEAEALKEKLDSGELKPEDLKINEEGQVVDAEGNVLGTVGLADGAAEKLKEQLPPVSLDLRILDGKKINKKGKILDEEGEEIGELTEGELSDCAGKRANDKGEILDKDGKVIGRVSVVPGEAAETATKELLTELGEVPEEAEETAEEAEEQKEEDVPAGPQYKIPNLDTLEGLKVNKKGKVLDEDGEEIGELVEGEVSECAGKKLNAKGEVLDAEGNVIGRVRAIPKELTQEEIENGVEDAQVVSEDQIEAAQNGELEEGAEEEGEGEAEAEGEAEGDAVEDDDLPPVSSLEGLTVNKAGKLIRDGQVVGELIEGDAKKISKLGATADDQGQFWDNKGKVIGKAKTVKLEDPDEEAPFAGLEGLIVTKDGYVEDENKNRVGVLVQGEGKALQGRAVDEDGDVIDKKGTVVGHAERWSEEEAEEEAEAEPVDFSSVIGKPLTKTGLVIGEGGVPIARLVEGDAKQLAGKKVSEEGKIWNDQGRVIGRVEMIPEEEREQKSDGPFAGLEGLHVVANGKVADSNDNIVGEIVEGNPKRLIGLTVDSDGDILSSNGEVKGHAEPIPDEEEPEAEDLSALANCTVNKAGNVVDAAGTIKGRVIEGDVKALIGKKVDGKGQIWSSSGEVLGRAELVHGQDTTQEGPFAGFEDAIVTKEGTVVTPSGDIIGRIIDGDVKKLVNHHPDESGDLLDRNGNVIGKAERWEPEQKEKKVSPMSGRKVNREGEVRSEEGDVIGRLTAGDLGHCIGNEVDDSGNVIDGDGNKIGEVTLLENIIEEEEDEEMSEEDKVKEEERQVAEKMNNICQQTLDRVGPICKQITDHIEKADRTPKEELDEEELVNNVKPLIEEGGRILSECNSSLRALDQDGHIAAQAKARAGTKEGTPEDHKLAETLKELTTTVVTTIDNAKKRINDMPHAKKKLNPLWSLLTQPLAQILAAVALLLAGVLGLVGQILSGLGLGGLVNGLMGGLGINKLLGGLGIGGLTGGDSKKKSGGGGAKNLPIVGGLLGGK